MNINGIGTSLDRINGEEETRTERKALHDKPKGSQSVDRSAPLYVDDDPSSFSDNMILSGLPGRTFASCQDVEGLMREQDADLLESMHGISANDAGTTPVLTSLDPPLGLNIDGFSLSDHCQPLPEDSPVSVPLRDQSGLHGAADAKVSTVPPSGFRRSLSGEVWVKRDRDDTYIERSDKIVEPRKLFQNSDDTTENDTHTQTRKDEDLKAESMSKERRANEAAQFAEVVGDLPPSEQQDLRIDEESPEYDDDDATEIHIETESNAETNMTKIFSSPGKGSSRIQPESPALSRKSRPQWPFGSSKRIFLDMLPEQNGGEAYVYKGIQCNPPEIVKRGITRGNYAQLHRKAWLEVSDKYHRYGKNLRLYYRHWEALGCPTNMFFDWLDSKGEAAGQPLPELAECPRSILDADTVLYISDPEVSGGYAISFTRDENGRGKATDVDGDPVLTGPDGWIFVLRDGIIYGAEKVTSVSGQSKQRFHHSSFFGGKAVAAAGIFITGDDGVLTRLYPHSGHYRPGEADMQRVLFYLYNEGVDLRTFDMDMQQINHVARDNGPKQKKYKFDKSDGDKAEKKKKVESLQLVPAVLAACFLAHKARFIGAGIFRQVHKIRKANVASVKEAVCLLNNS